MPITDPPPTTIDCFAEMSRIARRIENRFTVLKIKSVPFKERGMIVIGGRFAMSKRQYAFLKLGVAGKRFGKAFTKALRIHTALDWFNRILGGDT